MTQTIMQLAIDARSAVHKYYIGKEMPDVVYQMFATLRDDIIPELKKHEGWQPIETAPINGSILISSTSQGVMEACHWNQWYSDSSKKGWMPANQDEEYGSYVDDVTHWMPLPKAPI